MKKTNQCYMYPNCIIFLRPLKFILIHNLLSPIFLGTICHFCARYSVKNEKLLFASDTANYVLTKKSHTSSKEYEKHQATTKQSPKSPQVNTRGPCRGPPSDRQTTTEYPTYLITYVGCCNTKKYPDD